MLLGGLGVLLGLWSGGGRWLGGLVGCPWWGLDFVLLFTWQCDVTKGLYIPLKSRRLPWFLIPLALVSWPFASKKKRKKNPLTR